MYVEIKLTLDVGKQDTKLEAVETAKDVLMVMDFDELIDIMTFETNIHPK